MLQPIRPLSGRRQQRLLGAFKALADPTRLEILRLIRAQTGPTCVCDIVDHFELAQPTISHHLKVLKHARLLLQTRVGPWSSYASAPESADPVEETRGLLA